MKFLPLFAILLAIFFQAPTVHGGIIIKIEESGSDVIITTSGSLNTTGLTGHADATNSRRWSTGFPGGSPSQPWKEWIAFGATGQDYYQGDVDGLVGYTSDVSWAGSNNALTALDLDSGLANFGFRTGLNSIWIPDNYVSGTSVSQVLRRKNASFASLGLNVGDDAEASWTGVSAASGDTMRMEVVGLSAVPEPASLAIFGAICLLGCGRHRRS